MIPLKFYNIKDFNKGLAPSFNMTMALKANLPFSRRLYLPLNGEM